MKIVNYTEFSKLPVNTVYGFYHPCIMSGIYIKGDSRSNNNNDIISDWYFSSINEPMLDSDEDNIMSEMENKGISVDIDVDIQMRDGMFDYDRKFVIYEKSDVIKIIEKLKETL